MRIANNISALSAFNSLAAASKNLQKSIQALSSGLRINSAADDASGLAVSEKLRSQISGLNRAAANTQDTISLIQTAEGALQETTSMLQRMRELCVQAANGTLTQQDREHINQEIQQLKKEINRTAKNTQFNKKYILNGSAGIEYSASADGLRAYLNGQDDAPVQEGNYEFDITAHAGKAQVLKTNMFSLQLRHETHTELVDGASGTSSASNVNAIERNSIAINLPALKNGDTGEGWIFENNQLIFQAEGKYNIKGSGTALTDRNIKLADGVSATVILSSVNITSSTYGFSVGEGASADVYLKGSNTLTASGTYAALEVQNGSTVNISSTKGDGETSGSLIATGGSSSTGGAGIGASYNGSAYGSPSGSSAGTITIRGGTINAQGGYQAAGIGGACYGYAGTISITGGNITSTGGGFGAGIGSGHHAHDNSGSVIKIAGGYIRAYGGRASDTLNGAGIGGACHSDSGTVLIKDGLVDWLDKANGYVNPASKNTAQVYAERGSSNVGLPTNTAQDIGHGTDSQGSTGELDEADDIDIPERETDTGDYDDDTVLVSSTYITTNSEDTTFINSEGVSVFSSGSGQKLTISQADGKSSTVHIYEEDTVYDIARKINDAIAYGLGQAKYTDDAGNFCTVSDGTNYTSEALASYEYIDEEGTEYEDSRITGYDLKASLVIRSVIPGKSGELTFSGSQEFLDALGINEIQHSTETTYSTSIRDAHSGHLIAQDIHSTGSIIHGAIGQNIDVEFDPMTGILAHWDEHSKTYSLHSTGSERITLHVKDTALHLQTGANQGEKFTLQIGDMSCESLGLLSVNTSSQENSSRSITVIDNAIDRVLTLRAKLGASQNTLEHSMNYLTVAAENLTSSESRLRSADMAKIMMKFTKLNIMLQAGNSILAQANQLPNQVLSLMR